MSQVISGGIVCYEDGVKSAEEFAPARKVRVELRFDVPQDATDAQAVLDLVSDMAQAQVHKLLKGGKRAATSSAPVAAAEPGTTPGAVPTKADLAAAAGHPVEAVKQSRKKAPKIEQAEQPAAEAKAADDMSEFDVPASTAAEINDQDLLTAIQKKNAVLKDPQKIRAIITEFNPKPGQPFQAREIAQDKRTDFLTKLEALK
jgi:hypothetical protein